MAVNPSNQQNTGFSVWWREVPITAKATLGIGVVMIVIGFLLVGISGLGLKQGSGFSIEDEVVWSGNSGVYVHNDTTDWGLLIFVSYEVRCDDFELNVSVVESDSDGKVWYEHDRCVEDGRLPSGHIDDPEGWLHMGTVRGLEDGASYELTSREVIDAVPERVVVELFGDAIGVFAGLGGGFTCLCCGFPIFLLGLILVFTMREDNPATFQLDAEGRVILNQGGGLPNTVPISPDTGGFEDGKGDGADAWYKQVEK